MSEEIKKFILENWYSLSVIEEKYPELSNIFITDKCILGILYDLGIFGYPKDYYKAKKLYHNAVKEKNCSYAMTCLGHCFQTIDRNISGAIYCYKEAIKLGNIYAMNNLAIIYYTEAGFYNFQKAIQLLNKSKDLGNSQAIVSLGHMYYTGCMSNNLNYLNNNFLKAIEFFKKAIELGNSDAMVRLGYMYYYGYSVPQDMQKAIKYYEQATDLGNIEAIHRLTEYYLTNNLLEKRQELIKILEKGIRFGDKKSLWDIPKIPNFKEYILEHIQLREELNEYAQNKAFEPNGIGAKMIEEHHENLKKELNNPK